MLGIQSLMEQPQLDNPLTQSQQFFSFQQTPHKVLSPSTSFLQVQTTWRAFKSNSQFQLVERCLDREKSALL